MYATRPLPLYRNDVTTQSKPPLEVCSSGYLIVADEAEVEAEADTCCFGAFHRDTEFGRFPFPQNKKLLKIEFMAGSGLERRMVTYVLWFIPVIDQPLSTNRYYVIYAAGKYKGYACTCSRQEDRHKKYRTVKGVKPSVFDHRNVYQQMEIFKVGSGFSAKAVATDGIPPLFLMQVGRGGWRVYASNSSHFQLSEALGLNPSLRRRMPQLKFPMSNNSSIEMVVGKWYCPFVFIREGRLKDQMKTSMFYEMTLERVWEEIYTCENDNTRGNVVEVNVSVKTEVNLLFGEETVKDDISGVDGVVWFRHLNHNEQAGLSLGLSLPIVEIMRLVHEGGWVIGGETEVRVEKVVELTEQWKRFGCFVLVERFCLKRMDGTLLLTCDKKKHSSDSVQMGVTLSLLKSLQQAFIYVLF